MPRNQSAGFSFGGGGAAGGSSNAGGEQNRNGAAGASGRQPAASVLTGPEREVAGLLTAAKQRGPEALKGVLKQLLLKWHPDKAPQGDDQESVAKREEATRVLRFVLQERERLGI